MKLLNKIWKEYEDERNSRKYFSEKRKERLQLEKRSAVQNKKNSSDNKNHFGKKLEYKGSTYKYGKPKYQTSLGLVK